MGVDAGRSLGLTEAEHLPRLFQANIDRLYQRVLRATLERLPFHRDAQVHGARSEAELLDQLARQIDNHTASEARRSFALLLAATFERQLRIWCRRVLPEPRQGGIGTRPLLQLVDEAAAEHALDLQTWDVRRTLEELALLANVVRHGDGRSCDALRTRAPALWGSAEARDFAISEEQELVSEMLRVEAEDLGRYARAIVRFWGLADSQPFAVVEPPY